MNKRLYVGGLPYRTTEAELKEAFEAAGEVESAVIISERGPMGPRSKGFGFVEMKTEDGAQAAISRFNGADFDGRTLTVSEARPAADRTDGPRGGGDRFSAGPRRFDR